MITVTYFRISILRASRGRQLDGCSDVQYSYASSCAVDSGYRRTVPVLCVGHWNEFFAALIYLNIRTFSPPDRPAQHYHPDQVDMKITSDLEGIQARQALSELLKLCPDRVASVPVLAVYPSLQKYFVQGTMLACKGSFLAQKVSE